MATASPIAGIDNPFVGVRPFEPHESLLFHGRKEHTQQLLRLLSSHRFLGVTGTSGSGKSSLVKAGLLPALHRGYLWNKFPLESGDDAAGRGTFDGAGGRATEQGGTGPRGTGRGHHQGAGAG